MTLSLKIADASFSKTVAGLMLLDSFPSAAIALSLRRLKGDWADAVIRVRNSSSGAEADIELAGVDLDTATMLTHIGANDGHLTRIYDQSGNALNALQPTQAAQAKVVSAGAVIEQNSRPVAQADGTDDLMMFDSTTIQSAFVVAKLDAITASYHHIVGGVNQGFIWGGSAASNSHITVFQSPDFISSGYEDTTAMHQATFVSDGVTLSLYVDGVLKASDTTITSLTLDALFGQRAGTFSPCKFAEFIGYAGDKSADRAAIEANQKAYWGTP